MLFRYLTWAFHNRGFPAGIDAVNRRFVGAALVHRAIKKVTKPMLNFKSFRTARCVLAGIELMHMIRKDQCMVKDGYVMLFTDQFNALTGKIRPV